MIHVYIACGGEILHAFTIKHSRDSVIYQPTSIFPTGLIGGHCEELFAKVLNSKVEVYKQITLKLRYFYAWLFKTHKRWSTCYNVPTTLLDDAGYDNGIHDNGGWLKVIQYTCFCNVFMCVHRCVYLACYTMTIDLQPKRLKWYEISLGVHFKLSTQSTNLNIEEFTFLLS